eukprot:3821301-Pleurochrysis_carterae.AAC.1
MGFLRRIDKIVRPRLGPQVHVLLAIDLDRLHPTLPVLHPDASAEGRVAVTAARQSSVPALPCALLLPPRGTPKRVPILQAERA